MKKNYNSEILESLHETAAGLHKIGLISDQEMQEYDHDCLVSEPVSVYENSNTVSKPVPVFAVHDKK